MQQECGAAAPAVGGTPPAEQNGGGREDSAGTERWRRTATSATKTEFSGGGSHTGGAYAPSGRTRWRTPIALTPPYEIPAQNTTMILANVFKIENDKRTEYERRC